MFNSNGPYFMRNDPGMMSHDGRHRINTSYKLSANKSGATTHVR